MRSRILPIFWNWTPKNIPDRLQCVYFWKRQKVLYHNTLKRNRNRFKEENLRAERETYPWGKILTCTYIASLWLLYLDLCWGKKNTFTPLPLSISAIIQADWLISFFIKYFVSFLPAGTLMHIRLLMYPVHCTNALPYVSHIC